ncbi:MAG TPA: DUF2069 domain-containing protein [Cellvibrio sp.]|jgi:uncharacterized membrane protein|nr:DUF2069 domain-containing protein [Cellvibrio sp.]
MSEKEPLIITDAQAVVIHRKLRGMQRIFFISFGALLVLFTLNNLLDEGGSLKLWLVQSIPLLIFIPGLMQQRFRTYSWICFVILVYFTWSVVNTMSPLVRWQDVVVVVLTVVIFISAMMISRWMQYWQYYQRQQSNIE